MKKRLSALVLAIAACSSANATILTFEYTAKVDVAVTTTAGSTSWDAAQFGAFSILKDQTVQGTLIYDTDMPFWFSPMPNYAVYRGGVGALNVNVLENGFNFQSVAADDPQMSISNQSTIYPGQDAFGFSTHTRDIDAWPVVRASFFLVNDSGLAFDSVALPSALDLGLFEQRTLTVDWRSDEVDAEFQASITSLELVNDLPEPGSLALMFAGLGLLFARRRT